LEGRLTPGPWPWPGPPTRPGSNGRPRCPDSTWAFEGSTWCPLGITPGLDSAIAMSSVPRSRPGVDSTTKGAVSQSVRTRVERRELVLPEMQRGTGVRNRKHRVDVKETEALGLGSKQAEGQSSPWEARPCSEKHRAGDGPGDTIKGHGNSFHLQQCSDCSVHTVSSC
jgi:hypothetical protein